MFACVGSVGIAHGATDVDAVQRIGIRPRGGRWTLSIAYGLLAIATFALARRSPKRAARALLGLSVWHFGSGDVAFAAACGSRVRGIAESLVRGAMPLFIAGRSPRSLAAAALAAGWSASHLRTARYDDALDFAIPTALLLAAPPRLGFGIYFGAWHSVRHTALLLERDTRAGSERDRALRFARESAPNVAIAVLAGIIAYALDRRGFGAATASPPSMQAERSRENVVGALILAITVPHQIAVTLLERDALARTATGEARLS